MAVFVGFEIGVSVVSDTCDEEHVGRYISPIGEVANMCGTLLTVKVKFEADISKGQITRGRIQTLYGRSRYLRNKMVDELLNGDTQTLGPQPSAATCSNMVRSLESHLNYAYIIASNLFAST